MKKENATLIKRYCSYLGITTTEELNIFKQQEQRKGESLTESLERYATNVMCGR